MLKSMSNEFIFKKISFRFVIINQDSRKRERYRVNHDTNNDENNLQHMLRMAKSKI